MTKNVTKNVTNTKTKTNTKTVFVMDDDVIILELLSEILSDSGYQVRTATTGKFAIRSIQKSSPDLVLMDIKLPDMSGIEVYQSLKSNEQTCNIPVIFMSGVESNKADDREAIKDCDYLLKPVEMFDLLSRLQQFFSNQA